MNTQSRTVNGTKYGFTCSRTRTGFQDIEVYADGFGTLTYPKYRFFRLCEGAPWTLDGRGDGQTTKIKDELSTIWDGGGL